MWRDFLTDHKQCCEVATAHSMFVSRSSLSILVTYAARTEQVKVTSEQILLASLSWGYPNHPHTQTVFSFKSLSFFPFLSAICCYRGNVCIHYGVISAAALKASRLSSTSVHYLNVKSASKY